jgi:hypothetical protein
VDGVTIIASPRAAHQVTHQQALANGFAAHGVNARLAHSARHVTTHRVACWGWRMGRQLRAAGHDVLVMERGYIGDRFTWSSLAWNGLNGRGHVDAVPEDGGERFNQYFSDLLQPPNPDGDYVLIVGQVPGDAALGGRDLHGWYCEQAAKPWSVPVRFRPHPLARRRGPVRPVSGTALLEGDLSAALAGAAIVCTYNSNTGVDAMLAGKRVTAADEGSMIWGAGDREQWAHRLAWRQWTMDEIASGFALEHVGLAFNG